VRVLYLTDKSSVHNRRFLEKLASTGYEVWFWDVTASRVPDDMLPKGIREVRSTKSVQRNAPLGAFAEFLPEFQSKLNELRPALIHAGPIQSCGYLVALADFHPTLLMSWGSDILMEPEHNSEWRQATDFALKRADAFFCDCDTVRVKARSFREFPDSHIVQFPWGVKPGVFSPAGPLPPAEPARRKEGTTFICTRAWEPLYGADTLLEGFRRARSTNPSLRLILLGSGSEEQSIRCFLRSNDLNDAVSLLGPRPAEELPMWFRAADAYVSCAKSDGTSISLLEAMATGLPVVVTDIPSNREWVVEPDNGWLVPIGSPKGVADRLLRAARLSSRERETISCRNRRIVADRADWDKNFPRLPEMYERIVQLEKIRLTT